jgi:hypothetical protein
MQANEPCVSSILVLIWKKSTTAFCNLGLRVSSKHALHAHFSATNLQFVWYVYAKGWDGNINALETNGYDDRHFNGSAGQAQFYNFTTLLIQFDHALNVRRPASKIVFFMLR